MLLFKKKNLIILALALTCTALTLCFSFYIYNNEKSAHADTCKYHVTPLTASMTTLATGDYYLTGDLTISSQFTLAAGANVNICLNGYMITSNTYAFFVNSGTALNVYDCGNTIEQKHFYTKNSNGRYVFGTSGTEYISGGVICTTNSVAVVFNNGGTVNILGGAVAGCQCGLYTASGTTNVYGGTVRGNSSYGIGVSSSGTLNMYGGEITDNGGGNTLGGLNMYGGDVTVQGDVKIYGNIGKDGTERNLYFDPRVTTSSLTVGSTGLSAGATIGVTVPAGQDYYSGGFFTNSSSQPDADLINNVFFDDSNSHRYGTLIPQVDPTCTTDGVKAHYICSIHGEYFDASKNEVDYSSLIIPATGHSYTVSWKWATDYSSATATYVCSVCGDTGTLTATSTSVKTDPDCTSDGNIVYTATVTLPDGTSATDTATDTIPAKGHSYIVTGWVWASDYSSATATYVCANCGDTGTLTATPTSVKTDPDCTTDGNIVYTATVTLPDGTYATDTATDTIPAKGHSYTVTGWVWASDYSTATATYVCSSCGDTGTVTGTPSYVQTDPTCDVDGLIGYTVTVTLPDGTTATDNNGQTLPATGHQWDSGTVVPPTCTDDGYTEYTCGVCGDTKQEDIVPATGHTYQFSGWKWADDYSSASVEFICSVCGDKITYPADSITFVDDEEEGTRTYTATAVIDGVTYTDEQTIPIPAPIISGCMGCAGGIDWLLILCIGMLLFDVVMFAITMRVICSKPKDDDDEENDEEQDGDDNEYEFY